LYHTRCIQKKVAGLVITGKLRAKAESAMGDTVTQKSVITNTKKAEDVFYDPKVASKNLSMKCAESVNDRIN
jgi:hypothetical protein